jgi:hypothetical protein
MPIRVQSEHSHSETRRLGSRLIQAKHLTLDNDRVDANGVPIPGTGSFGTISSTRAGIHMRELQFSLKLLFGDGLARAYFN